MTASLLIVCLLVTAPAAAHAAPAATGPGAFLYRNIIPGVTPEREMLAALGTPSEKSVDPDGSVAYAFAAADGETTNLVTTRGGRVISMVIERPDRAWRIDDVKKALGAPDRTGHAKRSFRETAYVYARVGMVFLVRKSTGRIVAVHHFEKCPLAQFERNLGRLYPKANPYKR